METIVIFNPKPKGESPGVIRLPLALLCISSLIHNQYKIKIIDQRVETDWEQKFRRLIENEPLCVGITSMTGEQIHNGLFASKIVKEYNKEIPVIWGGIHPTLLPEQTLENEYVDVIVRGEGEKTFQELVDALASKSPLKGIKGISFKEDGRFRHNEERDYQNLNELPDLPYHLVNMEFYVNTMLLGGNQVRLLHLESSRGCPHRCGFCYNNSFNKQTWRSLNSEKTVERLEKLINLLPNITAVHFQDDNFFVSKKRVEEICKILIEKDIDITWRTTCRIEYFDRFDDSFIDLLESSGCKMLYFGIESGSNRILKFINKDITKEQVIAINKRLAKTNIFPRYSFMSAFPTETIYEVKETIALLQRLVKDNKNAHVASILCYTPFPGTELYESCIKYGLIPPRKLEDWTAFNYSNLHAPWLAAKEKKNLETLSFLGWFLDGRSGDEYLQYTFPKPIGNILGEFAKMYSLIARMRCNHWLLQDFLDTYILKKITKF